MFVGTLAALKLGWHKLLICFLTLDHLWRRITEWEEDWKKTTALFGRRRSDNMGIGNDIQDVEALIALLPLVLKFIEDARAAAPALEADAVDLKSKVEAIFTKTSAPVTPTPVTPPPPASAG